jgi:tetratricopeptide (TPR) repeat protein
VAVLLLLGPLVLAIPGAQGVLYQAFTAIELTGTGVALLATLPVAWLVALRSNKQAVFSTYLVVGLWVVFELSAMTQVTHDSLERDRALSLLLTGVVLCAAAGGLRETGRAFLGRLLCLLSLLLLLPPLIEAALGAARLFLSGADPVDAVATLSGVLGNAGELSNAAIPGALFGVLMASRTKGPWRALGVIAGGSLLLHATFAPALSTLGAAVIVGLFAAIAGRMQSLPSARTRGPLLFAVLAFSLGAGRFALRALPSGPAEQAPVTAQEAEARGSSDLGGLKVRELITRASINTLNDAPLLGHGPGQFVVVFPPHRDSREIELSSHERSIGAETEVEHAHSDLVLGLVEAGWLGGITFLFVLLHALRSIRRALSHGNDTEAGLALGLAGLIVVSFFHAPLLHHPFTSALGFVLLGATSVTVNSSGLRSTRWLSIALAVLLSAHAPRALAITRHGDALKELGAAQLDAGAQLEVVERMLTACPDSVIALSRRARLLPYLGGTRDETLLAWEAVLKLRPHRVEAHLQSAVLLAQSGDLEPARHRFNVARELDPNHPALLRNLARVELFSARALAGTDLLDELDELGRTDKLWRLGLATDLLLEGFHEEALVVLERIQLRFRDLTAEKCYQLAIEYRRTGGDPRQARVADAFECTAHRLWARRHAEGGDWDSARRSFRQALRFARRDDLSLPARFELEFSAILWRSKMPTDARDAFQRAGNDAVAWRALPVWAGEALLDLQRSDGED